MINMTFIIDNTETSVDYSNKLSTFSCSQRLTRNQIITTLDGNERQFIGKIKTDVTVSFMPFSKEELDVFFGLVKNYSFYLTFTNPFVEEDVRYKMRIDGEIDTDFALTSINGKTYYTGLKLKLIQMWGICYANNKRTIQTNIVK